MTLPTLQLALLPRTSDLPGRLLMNLVSPEALARSETFLSEKRRLEFLWSRVLLGCLLQDEPQACVVESPPRSPRVEGGECSQTSISHTLTWIGAGLGSVPFGIDIEVMRPNRVSEQLFTRLFAKRHWDASADRTLDFYAFFGMYEAAVKMNIPFCSDCDVPYVGNGPGQACDVRFYSDGETLVTVVSKTAADVRLKCFRTEGETLIALSERENPFRQIAGPASLRE